MAKSAAMFPLFLLSCYLWTWLNWARITHWLSAQSQQGTLIPNPQLDPFYQPPDRFELQVPGTILRQREVATSFFGIVADPVEGYQLLYRTTALDGSATAAVTTVFKPANAKTDRFIAFHTAYDSAFVDCEPSYQYQRGVVQTDLISSFEMLLFQRHLAKGYIVSSPDHEGIEAAFGAGRLAGIVALDAMRAVVNFQDTLGFSIEQPAIVGTGYSGGALATGWGASLQASYAPDLNIKGWVAGGTPSNMTGTLLNINNGPYSGFIPAAIDGLCKPSAYGTDLQPVIDRIITPEGQSYLDFANTNCFLADLINFRNKSIFSPDVQTLGSAILNEPTIHSILSENVLGVLEEETPIVPVFVYHGVNDDVIPYRDAATMVDAWCANGATVHFTSFAKGGHSRTALGSLADVNHFIENAFAGTLGVGCSANTSAGMSDSEALVVGFEPALEILLNRVTDSG
ncbi:secretory lipase-domain-containing protein [Aspergillus crustosus]